MHYLEDDLELLQTIPDELKRKCYEMRELEIRAEKVQSEVKEESRELFDSLTAFDAIEKERRYRKIKEGYREVKELREERLDICNYVHIMLEKYQKRLERDLTEFKMELDADLPGTTETIERELWESILERRRELLQQQQQDEAGEMPPPASTSRANGQRNEPARRLPPTKEEGTLCDDGEAPPKKMPSKVPNADNPPGPGTSSSMHTDVVPLNSAVFGPSTQALMPSSPFSYPVGPTPSMNLSSMQSTSAGSSLAGREAAPMSPSMSSVVMPVFSGSQESQYGRPVKLTSRVQQMFKEQNFRASGRTAIVGGTVAGQPTHPSKIGIRMDDDVYTTDVGVEEPDDEEEDQNVYCICQQPSHGAMVACDNQNCQHGEWFHYPCVGISRPPEGKWYCPECSKFIVQPQQPR